MRICGSPWATPHGSAPWALSPRAPSSISTRHFTTRCWARSEPPKPGSPWLWPPRAEADGPEYFLWLPLASYRDEFKEFRFLLKLLLGRWLREWWNYKLFQGCFQFRFSWRDRLQHGAPPSHAQGRSDQPRMPN